MEKLYRPVIVKKEIDNSHFYFVDDEFFPGVTRILNSAPVEYGLIEFWKNNTKEESESILEHAATRGSRIHEACEMLLHGQTLNLAEDYPKPSDKKMITAFVNFMALYQPKLGTVGELLGYDDPAPSVEMTVASGQYKYAGTLDIYCKIDPEVIEAETRKDSSQLIMKPEHEHWIIDIKTSNSVHTSHKLQLLAYKQAFKEMTGIDANIGILHLTTKTKAGYKFYTDLRIKKSYSPSIDDFMNVYKLYVAYNGGRIEEPPMVDAYPEIVSLTESK